MKGIFYKGSIEENYIGHQMSEIYRDQIYKPLLYGKKDLTILDVGANIGITSLYFSQFAKQIYALEPSYEHFEVMTHMLNYNEIDNVKAIKKALYIEDGELPLYHNKNKTMFSLHQNVNDQSSDPETIDAITLSTLFEQENIEHVDLMKLDVEGSEFEILSGKDFRELCKHIDMVITETHTWAERNPQQLIDVLKMRGYTVEKPESTASLFIARR